MKVKDFIELMQKTKEDKVKEVLDKRLTTDYVNFERKVDMCQKIIKNTSYSEISEESSVWKKQNAMEFLFFNIKLISTYTDVEIEDGNVLENYNALNKLNYVTALLCAIPQRELVEFNDIMNLCKQDQESNERNLVSAILDLLALFAGMGNKEAVDKVKTEEKDSVDNIIPVELKTE